MKRLRRLSLSFRQSRSRHVADSDSNVEGSVRAGTRTACSDDEALPRQPRRRLTKKRHSGRPPLASSAHDVQSLRVPPSPSPSPTPPLARVPFPVQKRVPPPVLPDPSSFSSSTGSPPEQTPDPLTPNTPPAPTPLSVIVEQDERSLRSAGFSLHSTTAAPLAATGEHERERRRTASGLSSLKDAVSRAGSTSDKARSIYERPSAPAPPSPPATPTRELDPQTSSTLAGTSPDERNAAPDADPLASQDDNPAFESTLHSHPTPSPSDPPRSTSQTGSRTSAHNLPYPPSSYAPHSSQIHTSTSSTTLTTHSPTDTEAYATAAESLMGDTDEPDPEQYPTLFTTSTRDADASSGEPIANLDHQRFITPVMYNHDDDTPTPTVRARDRPRVRVANRDGAGAGAGARLGEVYQYPPARHTFGLWDAEGAQDAEEGVDSGDNRDSVDSVDSGDSGDELREESARSSGSGSVSDSSIRGPDQNRDEAGDQAEMASPIPMTSNYPWRTPTHLRHPSSATTFPITPTSVHPTPLPPLPLNVDRVRGSAAVPTGASDSPPIISEAPVPIHDPTSVALTPTPASIPPALPLPPISESASLPHLSDSLPLPLPSSSDSHPQPPVPSSHSEPEALPQLQSDSEPPAATQEHSPPQPERRISRIIRVPVPQDLETQTSLPPRPRTLRPHPFLEGHAGEKLGGRGGGVWDVNVNVGGEEREGEGERERDKEKEKEKEEEQGNEGDGEGGETNDDAKILVHRTVPANSNSKVRVTSPDDSLRSRTVSTTDQHAMPSSSGPEQAHPVKSSISKPIPLRHITSGTSPNPTHPPRPPGLPISRSHTRTRTHLAFASKTKVATTTPTATSNATSTSSAAATNTTTPISPIPTSPITFAQRASLAPTLTSTLAPSSPPASPPPAVTSFSPPDAASRRSSSSTGASAPPPGSGSTPNQPPSSLLSPSRSSPTGTLTGVSPPPSSPSPLSRSASLTRLITSALSRPSRTLLKRQRGERSVSSSGRDEVSRNRDEVSRGGGRGTEPSFTMVAGMTGDAYAVEPWRRDNNNNSALGDRLPRRGAQAAQGSWVIVQPPSPSPSSVEGGVSHPHAHTQLQPPQQPSRQQQYSWAGQEEFTASLVAEYGAMLTPFLATPGNTRPPTQAYHDGDAGAGGPGINNPSEAQPGSVGHTLDTLRSVSELERAALVGVKPPKRVGRKLSKRRRPEVDVPVPGR